MNRPNRLAKRYYSGSPELPTSKKLSSGGFDVLRTGPLDISTTCSSAMLEENDLASKIEESIATAISHGEGGVKETSTTRKGKTLPQASASNQPTIASLWDELQPLIINTVTAAVTAAVTKAVSVAMAQVMSAMKNERDDEREVLSAQLLKLSFQQDRQEQYSRRESMRIRGIPEKDEEDLADEICKIATAIDVPLKKEDISVTHRTGKKGVTPRDVLCRFVSRASVTKLLSARKHLKDKDGFKSTYINEDLTTLRSRMLKLLKSNPQVKRAHTKNGRIHCNYGHDDRHVVIDTPDDLFRVGYDNLPFADLGIENPLAGGTKD